MDKTGFIPSFWVDVDVRLEDESGEAHELQPGARVRFRKDFPYIYVHAPGEMTRAEYVQWAIPILKRQVLEWTGWTDVYGHPYPPRSDADGFEAALLDLMPEERGWLLDNCWEQAAVPND